MNKYLVLFVILWSMQASAQYPVKIQVFEDFPVNFKGEKRDTSEVIMFQGGRLIFKRIEAPVFEEGTDVQVKMTLKSAGDPWDKSGSLFVITDPEKINLMDIARGKKEYPATSGVLEKYPGIRKSENYTPPLEILRFMTPFGVGYFSDEEKNPRIKYNRPVYVPKWEDKVVWEQDISALAQEVTGDFYLGLWLDTWTNEGYIVDVSLEYSGRPKTKREVIPLVNTVYYAGQEYPDLFAFTDLNVEFELPENAKNAKLHYITTGHGGHNGGDEFIKIRNKVTLDGKVVIDTIPWRDDCASFRRFNPSSGVWTRKDTAYAYVDGEKELIAVKERLASSDLSRSNWCPGSKVEPIIAELGALEEGKYKLSIHIPATPIDGDKLNHWLVSAYLTYEKK
ncbi:MAG TPA: PNGase F N-terminal domain-containing protein [Salinimicrobium sp.]|nr:PNGase F N-terminal domain-containing protein [Salinimicrobium sp.]